MYVRVDGTLLPFCASRTLVVILVLQVPHNVHTRSVIFRLMHVQGFHYRLGLVEIREDLLSFTLGECLARSHCVFVGNADDLDCTVRARVVRLLTTTSLRRNPAKRRQNKTVLVTHACTDACTILTAVS